MRFELDAVYVEEEMRATALARRVIAALPPGVPVCHVPDGRIAARADRGAADPFAAGKRRMVIMRRRARFLTGCPAASNEFACCGYLVMELASNCPMDCGYCFLQEFVADNPGFQVYANYADAFAELDRVQAGADRPLRIGTGELADSLAFDSLTGMSRDLVRYFAGRDDLTLELKTKTDEIENLLEIDSRGRTLVSWTLSPGRVFHLSEHRTAPPAARIAAARRVLEAGYRVGFHLDPIIACDGADRDYAVLLDELFAAVPAARIEFISLGGLRMTPGLRAAARRRFPRDPMLLGEEVLAPDGRYRAFAPLRMRLYEGINRRIAREKSSARVYLCMENAAIYRRVLGAAPPMPAALGAALADGKRRDG